MSPTQPDHDVQPGRRRGGQYGGRGVTAERRRAARRRFLRAAVATVAGIGLAGPWMARAEGEPVDGSETTPRTEPDRETAPEVAGPAVFWPTGVPPTALAIPSLGVDARI